jgi:Protein of unknown function (DUF3347)
LKKTILMVAVLAIAFTSKIGAQETADSSLQSVITSYLDVKNALTKDNGANVRSAAKTLYTSINTVPMEKLPDVEHRVWMEYQEKLSYDAEHIKNTDELDHQREHFIKLSANFYNMIKAININKDDLYYQFCPMANDGKGAYWVSEKQAIANPYFGKKMMTCGSTKETLKARP